MRPHGDRGRPGTAGSEGRGKAAHDLPKEDDVLAADNVESERDVGKAHAEDDALDSALKYDVSKLVE